MNKDLVTFNIPVPHKTPSEILEIVGYGLSQLITDYCVSGIELDDYLENQSSTTSMGEAIFEYGNYKTDEEFFNMYQASSNILNVIKAAHLEDIQNSLDSLLNFSRCHFITNEGFLLFFIEEE